VRYKEFVVSSTRIRRLIAEGRVDEAGALLGHHYFIDGAVIRGDGRGHSIGFPTANLRSDNELRPPRGVYATLALVDGVNWPSVTNVGVRPTFTTQPDHPHVETHMLDFGEDIYGQDLRLAFLTRLRDEQRFPDVESLVKQIQKDITLAREFFESSSSKSSVGS